MQEHLRPSTTSSFTLALCSGDLQVSRASLKFLRFSLLRASPADHYQTIGFGEMRQMPTDKNDATQALVEGRDGRVVVSEKICAWGVGDK
jgi:hypothetical protein